MVNILVVTRCDLFDGHVCILLNFSKYFVDFSIVFATVNYLVGTILLIFQDILLQ
jgi:hypothetical protein